MKENLENIANENYKRLEDKIPEVKKTGFLKRIASGIKNYVANNTKKVGLYTGIGLFALSQLFGGTKKANAQDLNVPPIPAKVADANYSGSANVIFGGFKDPNCSGEDKWRGFYGLKGLFNYKFNENFLLSPFAEYEHINPGTGVSKQTRWNAGAQGTFWADNFFVALAAAFEQELFGQGHGAISYLDEINKARGRVSAGVRDIDLGKDWKFNFAGFFDVIQNFVDQDYFKDRRDFAAGGLIEFIADKNKSNLFFKFTYFNKHSQEYLISDTANLDEYLWEGGFEAITKISDTKSGGKKSGGKDYWGFQTSFYWNRLNKTLENFAKDSEERYGIKVKTYFLFDNQFLTKNK
ncbi:hypothetical protein DRJ25_02565, partial [Candidatus Woesearchaeota archaeon]